VDRDCRRLLCVQHKRAIEARLEEQRVGEAPGSSRRSSGQGGLAEGRPAEHARQSRKCWPWAAGKRRGRRNGAVRTEQPQGSHSEGFPCPHPKRSEAEIGEQSSGPQARGLRVRPSPKPIAPARSRPAPCPPWPCRGTKSSPKQSIAGTSGWIMSVGTSPRTGRFGCPTPRRLAPLA